MDRLHNMFYKTALCKLASKPNFANIIKIYLITETILATFNDRRMKNKFSCVCFTIIVFLLLKLK